MHEAGGAAVKELGDREITDLRALVDVYIAESMADPDLATNTPDFRAGYEQGFREAYAAIVALMVKSRSQIRPDFPHLSHTAQRGQP